MATAFACPTQEIRPARAIISEHFPNTLIFCVSRKCTGWKERLSFS
jgi:hypothetical protein